MKKDNPKRKMPFFILKSLTSKKQLFFTLLKGKKVGIGNISKHAGN